MDILFITESGTGIGSGHLARTTALADAFHSQGFSDITFMIRGANAQYMFDRPYRVICHDWLKHPVATTRNSKILIIDSYSNSYKRFDSLTNGCNLSVNIVDGTSKYDRADILLSPTIYGDSKEYLSAFKDKVIYGGVNYLLFRKEFWDAGIFSVKESINKVGISLGSSNIETLTLILTSLKRCFGESLIVYIFGNSEIYSSNDFKRFSNLHVLGSLNSKRYIKYLLQMDILITNGGQTLNEALLLGIPTISICTEENQIQNINYLSHNNFTLNIDLYNFTASLNNLLKKLNNKSFRHSLSRYLKNSFDHLGGLRTVNNIIGHL